MSSLKMRTETSRDPEFLYTGVIKITQPISPNLSSFRGLVASSGSTNPTDRTNFTGITALEGENTFNIAIEEAINSAGVKVPIGNINSNDGLTGWQTSPTLNQTSQPLNNIKVGTKIVFKPFDDDGSPPGLPVTDYVIKGVIEANPNISHWIVRGQIKKLFKQRFIEIDKTFKTKPFVVKGKYWREI